jgi:hypothetical protein
VTEGRRLGIGEKRRMARYRIDRREGSGGADGKKERGKGNGEGRKGKGRGWAPLLYPSLPSIQK